LIPLLTLLSYLPDKKKTGELMPSSFLKIYYEKKKDNTKASNLTLLYEN
jgi:hypothetical protein